MSLPLPGVMATTIVSPFRPPWDEEYTPLEEAVTGGVNLGDGSQGRDVQRWVAYYTGTNIEVAKEDGTVVLSLAVPDVLTVSLGFDGNMAVAVAYQTAAGSNLYHFDTVSSTFITITQAGTTSCRCSADEVRQFNVTNSDVIWAYTRDGMLYYRQQRDRYLIEYPVGPSGSLILKRCGPNVQFRFQFHLGDYP